jgi:hypothetical protein
MSSSAQHIRSTRELAHRSNDGVSVTLFWHPETDELTVCVSDERRGAYFEIEADANNALDIFHHPYSYASQSYLYYEDAERTRSLIGEPG